jgi:hypothetical protein
VYNYCIEKTSRVILHLKNGACNYCIIPEKNVACNSEEKNGECKFEEKKTTSVSLKKKNDECNGKKKTASVYSHGPSRPSYIYIILILEEIIFISKGKVRCIQTLTVHVEVPSLETSKFSLYFSGSCTPINPKLSPRISSCFQFNFNSKYFVYILQQLPSMRRTHVPELCPPLTCERACSGNEIGYFLEYPFSYPEPFLRAARRGALAKSITGYHENMVIEYIRY